MEIKALNEKKLDNAKFVVYYRVSTKAQGESGLGLDAQKTYIGHFLNENEIVKEFVEVASAKSMDKKKRPLLNEAIEYCKANGYFLAVAKIDRLSRKTIDALTICEMLSGKIFACDLPSSKGALIDNFMLTIVMAVAQRERELIGIRTSQALQEKIAKGQKLGVKGAENWVKSKANEKAIKAKKENASEKGINTQALELIPQYRAQGMTLQAIADKMNSMKFKTSSSKAFTTSQVQYYLNRAKQLNG